MYYFMSYTLQMIDMLAHIKYFVRLKTIKYIIFININIFKF